MGFGADSEPPRSVTTALSSAGVETLTNRLSAGSHSCGLSHAVSASFEGGARQILRAIAPLVVVDTDQVDAARVCGVATLTDKTVSEPAGVNGVGALAIILVSVNEPRAPRLTLPSLDKTCAERQLRTKTRTQISCAGARKRCRIFTPPSISQGGDSFGAPI